MDDIKRPEEHRRRDYSAQPHHRPHAAPHQSVPKSIPVNFDTGQPNAQTHAHEPQHSSGQAGHHQAQVPHHPQPAVPAQPDNYPPAATPQPHYQPEAAHSQHYRPAPPQPDRQTVSTPLKSKKPARVGRKATLAISLAIVAAGLFGAGYALKGSTPQKGLPASVIQQAKFDLYFPSPMPHGYTYMSDTATFQIGQVYYKFGNGLKRVTVKEEPLPNPKPDLNLMAGFVQFDSAVGKVAMGSSYGEPTAVIITPTTVITMNTSGNVNQSDLKTAIANLKNIGQNPGQKPSNG